MVERRFSIDSFIEPLETQYQNLIRKVDSGEKPTPYDLPRINSIPTIPNEERQKIYLAQEGFQFHGMEEERLTTIFRDFHGTSVWIPYSCKDYLPFEEFERLLRQAYERSSAPYNVLLVETEPTEGGMLKYTAEVTRESTLRDAQKGEDFPWIDIGWMPLVYKDASMTQRVFKEDAIKPKLTIISAPRVNGHLGKQYKRDEEVINKLWLYMAWTKRH